MKRIAVIGAGAGGMFFAADFFHEDAETVVLEASQTPMQKVLLSGGGRCNFTNLNIDAQKPENFYPRGARFLRMPLRRFDAQNAVEFFESLGVESKVEDEGRVFPQSDKSQDIADALMGRAEKNGAKIILGRKFLKFQKTRAPSLWPTRREEKKNTWRRILSCSPPAAGGINPCKVRSKNSE